MDKELAPSVSVIIPSHNRVDRLPLALESVFAQTRPPDEVIVIDDGSDDGTDRIIRDRYPDVTLLRQVHRGVSAARNLGIRAASGEWLALLDSDDQWLAEKLRTQLHHIARSPDYRVGHTDEIWIRNGKRANPMHKHQKHGGYIFARCLPLCCISPSSAIIHRSVFEEVGLFDETLPACEDYDLWLRICSRLPVQYIDAPLTVKYGGHPDQLSRAHWGMDRFRIQALVKIVKNGALNPTDHAAAIKTLIQKIEIYLEGARKRSKSAEVLEYLKLLRFAEEYA